MMCAPCWQEARQRQAQILEDAKANAIRNLLNVVEEMVDEDHPEVGAAGGQEGREEGQEQGQSGAPGTANPVFQESKVFLSERAEQGTGGSMP